MKNKRNTYLLLTLVLIVWGMIGYRIFSSLGAGNESVVQKNIAVSFRPKPIKEQDTFSIHTFTRDPFLGTFKAKPVITKKSKPLVVKKEILWPTISYSGFMGDAASNQNIFFVSINNTQYLMKPNDLMQEITLIKGTSKEITVRFQKQKKVIPIKE